MDIFVILFFIYIIIGLIMYSLQENYVKENKSDFFNGINNIDYIKYVLFSVLLWFPNLIIFWFKNK